MGTKHSRNEILAAGLAEAFDRGLSEVTYGRVAARLGIPDRTVVYYFPTKHDLVSEIIGSMGLELQATLAPALAAARDHLELVRAAWPIVSTAEADRVFALFFEASGLAASGLEPYRTLIPQLVDGWIEWTATLMTGRAAEQRPEAEAAIALIDGLLLLRQLVGPDAADRAAARLNVTG